MVAAHRAFGTWANAVDVYVALSEFARGKFVSGGLPADRVVVKPNFLDPDPGVGAHGGGYALFVGRLSPEKGLGVLLDAWSRLGGAYPLKVVGGGPLEGLFEEPRPGVEWLGPLPRERVLALMRDAAFLVLPSECYENFPVTLAEAFATGLPVVASRNGSLAELVSDRETGLLFRVGDADDLAAAATWAAANPTAVAEMGRRARREFEAKYGAERNYARLLEIYRLAGERVATRAARGHETPSWHVPDGAA
jgi:glycosyltransferase involved in cell wall biosynthesis